MEAIRQEQDNHHRLHSLLGELDIETTEFINKHPHEQQRLVTEFLKREYGDDIAISELNYTFIDYTTTHISGDYDIIIEFSQGLPVGIIAGWVHEDCKIRG